MMNCENASQDFVMPVSARVLARADLRASVEARTTDFAEFVPSLGRCFPRDPELAVTDMEA